MTSLKILSRVPALDRQRHHHRLVARCPCKPQVQASPISPPRSRRFVRDAHAREGAVTLFIRHTSASLTIQENADPTVLEDLSTVLTRLAPENGGWRHRHRRPRRHAGAYQDHADLDVAAGSRAGRRARAWNVAGDPI